MYVIWDIEYQCPYRLYGRIVKFADRPSAEAVARRIGELLQIRLTVAVTV